MACSRVNLALTLNFAILNAKLTWQEEIHEDPIETYDWFSSLFSVTPFAGSVTPCSDFSIDSSSKINCNFLSIVLEFSLILSQSAEN